MIILLLIAIFVASYIIGSTNGAIIISKYVCRRDVRRRRKINPGYATFMNLYGVRGVTMLILFDVAKATAAVFLGGLILGTQDATVVGRAFAAFCFMLGHAFPFQQLLRGGKGVLCAGVMMFFIDWRVALCCWAVFILFLIFTRYTSVSYLMAAVSAPIFMWIFDCSALCSMLVLLSAIVIVMKYSENMVRLVGGIEPQIVSGSQRPSSESEDDYY